MATPDDREAGTPAPQGERVTSGDVIEAAYRLEQELREHVPTFPLASCAVRHVLEKHLSAAFLRSQADADRRVAEERARCAAREQQLIAVLNKARTFIEYARYELEPGELQHGDQFPRQGCADKMTAQIAEAIESRQQEDV